MLCKNRYVGRTFIQPSKRLRQLGVAKKFGALAENFKGKSIVIVDDSIVRGNTMGPIIRLLKSAGAKEVGFIFHFNEFYSFFFFFGSVILVVVQNCRDYCIWCETHTF